MHYATETIILVDKRFFIQADGALQLQTFHKRRNLVLRYAAVMNNTMCE